MFYFQKFAIFKRGFVTSKKFHCGKVTTLSNELTKLPFLSIPRSII